MRVLIEKAARRLRLLDGGKTLLRARIALGREPTGPKRREGDGRTPEGDYAICLVKPEGKYGRSLGLNYPNGADARRALAEGRIDLSTCRAIEAALAEQRRPPWGSPLGGEIYLHEGPTDRDWTQGCVALSAEDMAEVFAHWQEIDEVQIVP